MAKWPVDQVTRSAAKWPGVKVDQSLNGHCGPGGWVARQLGGQAAGWPGGWVAMVGQVTGWPGGWVARFARTCIQMHISFIHLHFLFMPSVSRSPDLFAAMSLLKSGSAVI